MAAIGEYIFSVSATALICGIVTGILKECSAEKPVKLICNMILLITILQPAIRWKWKDISQIPVPAFPNGEEVTSQAEAAARNAAADIIKKSSEAYILDKAAAMGLTITVEVSLSSDYPPIPVGVKIAGTVSPYMKLRLEEMIQEDLNIAKENQLWTG